MTNVSQPRRNPKGAAFACPWYPLTPLLYLVTVLGVAGATLVADPVTSLVGIGLLAAGVPIYYARRLLSRQAVAAGR